MKSVWVRLMKQSRRKPASLIALAGAMMAAAAAHAQTAPQSLQVSPLPHIMPPITPNLSGGLPGLPTGGAEAALPDATIPVGTVTIIGATYFPFAKLNAITAGLAGHQVTLARLEAARRAMVALYRGHGFILTTVSLNADAQGNVSFVVTEGYIASIKLSQNIGPAGTQVLAFLDHLLTERPVREASLERWLLLAQQIPGVSVHAVLRPDAADPGGLILVAEVSKQSVSGLLTTDDRSFRDTGPAEGLAVADLNSVTSYGDQTEVSLFHTSGNTDNFVQVAESAFVGTHGLRLRVYAGTGRAIPSGLLRRIAYKSQVQAFGAQLSYPLLLRRNQALNVALHFDGAENNTSIAGVRTSADSLRVGRAAADYAWQDLWAGTTRDALNIVNVQESDGLPILGSSPDGRAFGDGSRYRAKMDFWKLNAAAGRTQTLFTPVPQAVVSVRLEAGGQYTTDVLPSEEQFGLGGSHFTRGFYAGQVSGDKAAYATAELQLNTGYSVTMLQKPLDVGAQFYGFYDWGETWSNLATDPNQRIATTGVGVRLGLTRYLELDGEMAHRLTTRLNPQSSAVLPLSETVIYGGLTARY